MKFVSIKNASVPALGFGTYELKDTTAEKMVSNALEVGYRHIDTAQIYGNEAEVGKAIKNSGINRDELFITTKVWYEKLGKEDFAKSVDESLEKLQLDYVDLLLIHWPHPELEVASYMEDLVKAREDKHTIHIGVSNFTPFLLKKAFSTQSDIICNQVEYHPFLNQSQLLEVLKMNNMALTAYSPLAQGHVIDNLQLTEIGEKHNKSAAQVALRWLIQQDSVLAIPRTSSLENLKSNFDIFDMELFPEDMETIHKMTEQNNRIVNPGFSPQWGQAVES